jgi:N utilization substance protein B
MAMQVLYQADMRHMPVDQSLQLFFEESEHPESTVKLTSALVRGVAANQPDLDKIVTDLSIGWDLDRLSTIDRNLLRIGLYELQHTDSPPKAVIAEIVDLAKDFSTEESPKFVNGILGQYMRNTCLLDSSKP